MKRWPPGGGVTQGRLVAPEEFQSSLSVLSWVTFSIQGFIIYLFIELKSEIVLRHTCWFCVQLTVVPHSFTLISITNV